MKEKAVIFPCDRELVSFMKYFEFTEYEISGLCVLEDSNVVAENKEDIPILDMENVDFGLFGVVILVDETYYTHSFVKDSIERGKKLIDARQLKAIEIEKLDAISEEQKLEVPVIFVAGVTPYTEKFHVQLALRKRLLDNGYKVSLIGSKEYSGLFGFHSFPLFMSEPMDNTERILLFRKYVKYIEQQEQPDIIVVGIPGGIMGVNRKHHFDFGMTAYMVSQAVEPDYVIMNMLYGQEYIKEQLEEINQCCKYKLNFEIDSFHLSNSFFDPASLKSEQLVFIKMGNKKYLNRIERLYDLLNPTDMDKAFETMITKLSSYNVNQIF